MASIAASALRRLLPDGMPWRPVGMLLAFVEAVELSLERARLFIFGIIAESMPGSATELIEEWHEALGLTYVSTLTTDQQRGRLKAAYTSTGGASLEYVNAQLQLEFPLVMISEVEDGGSFTMEYTVTGDILRVSDLPRLYGIIERLVSLHLEPTYGIRVIESLDSAYTGAAITGKAITGRTVEE